MRNRKITIALAGNPNSGKTTMFNDLTGSSQYVGNWPGVTIEKKDGILRGHPDVVIRDLPGIYSLSPYTLEEVVSRDYLIHDQPDAIINIVDGTNIERNLYLTTQLIELGIPVVIAVNMIDIVRKNGDTIHLDRLQSALNCRVMETSALHHEGSVAVAEAAIGLLERQEETPHPHVFSGSVEHALAHIEESIAPMVEPRLLRWYAIKVFERDSKVLTELNFSAALWEHLEEHIRECELEMDDDAESIITNQRYLYIESVVAKSVQKKAARYALTISDRIDHIVTNRILALPIFAVVMFLVYYLSISLVGRLTSDWINNDLFGEVIVGNLTGWLHKIGTAEWLNRLILEGILSGVGAVIGFIPQMVMLFLLLSILEDIGYMARVAFIMDRLFRRFGLSGKSFIPLLVSSGCAVPGISASRTIEQERDRRMTIMTTSFIPCSAKMPMVALFAGALFNGSGLVVTGAYLAGIAAVIVSGVILKKTRLFAGAPAPFVMELPAYHMPSAQNILRTTWDRIRSYVVRAGTVILASSIVMWFLQAFAWNQGLRFVSDNQDSLLAQIGRLGAVLFIPLGFGFWQAVVASVSGLLAKENIVGTLGVLYGFVASTQSGSAWEALRTDFTPLIAFSFVLFNLLCTPCMAAVGAISREMNSSRWTWIAIGYMTGFAYAVSLIFYQFGLLYNGAPFSFRSAAAVVLAVSFIYLLFRQNPNEQPDALRRRKRRCMRCNNRGERD